MLDKTLRAGNFSSSEIVALTKEGTRDMTDFELKKWKEENPASKKKTITGGFGDAAYTYIAECNYERRLGCSIDDESNARPLTWGKLVEKRAFEVLPTSYTYNSSETLIHPTIDYWVGTPDGFKIRPERTTIDIKSPLSKKSFCQLVDRLYDGCSGIEVMNAIRFGYTDKYGVPHKPHKDGDKFYWQLVSNSIIAGTMHAELIVYMPYESELKEIMQMAQNVDTDQLGKHYWIGMANEGELPCLPDNGFYQNINIIHFETPLEDRTFLINKVLEAGKMLIPRHKGILFTPDADCNAVIVEKI